MSPLLRPGLVVLAGGTSHRWAGRDKTAADLAGLPVLVRVLDGAVPGASGGGAVPDLVVVAPADHPARAAVDRRWAAVRWVREEPPGGGPVAGLAAGVAALPQDCPLVAVLAGDLPFAGPALPRLVGALSAGGPGVDGAVGLDPGGRRQPLLAVYRVPGLRAVLAGLAGREPGQRGPSLRDVLAGLVLREVPVSGQESLDLDTPADLTRAARLLAGG